MKHGHKRTPEQRKIDLEFLARTMKESPSLTLEDYGDMLMDDVSRRLGQGAYTLSKVTIFNDINAINKISIDALGLNLTTEKSKAVDHHDFMITALLDELTTRINSDRYEEEVTIREVTAKDVEKFSHSQLMVFNQIRDKLEDKTTKLKKIRAGSDVKEICITLASIWKEKRAMLGIDAPKQSVVESKYTDIDGKNIEELIATLKKIGGDKSEMLNFVSSIFDNKN
jgi:hypothetical protein